MSKFIQDINGKVFEVTPTPKGKQDKNISAIILNKNPETNGFVVTVYYNNGDIEYGLPTPFRAIAEIDHVINGLRQSRGNESYTIALEQ